MSNGYRGSVNPCRRLGRIIEYLQDESRDISARPEEENGRDLIATG